MSQKEKSDLSAHPRRRFLKQFAAGLAAAAVTVPGDRHIEPQPRPQRQPEPEPGAPLGTLMPIGGGMLPEKIDAWFEQGKFHDIRQYIARKSAAELDPHGIMELMLRRVDAMPRQNGEWPTLELVSAGSVNPPRMAEIYAQMLDRIADAHGLNVTVRILSVDRFDDRAIAQRMARAGGVFMLGGTQSKLVDAFGSTEAGRQMIRRWRTTPGFLIAGTSAGAMAMAGLEKNEGGRIKKMMIKKRPDARHAAPPLTGSLGLLQHILVDTHVGSRDREGHILAAALEHPPAIVIGLDEGTYLVIENGRATAYGAGRVLVAGNALHIPDAASQRLTPGKIAMWQDCRSFTGMPVYCFRNGDGFALADLAPNPLLPPRPATSLAGSGR